MHAGLDLSHLLASYGAGALFVIICLESMGAPLPGESALIGTAVYAGTHPGISIVSLVAAATAGAILGDNIGYEIGRAVGLRVLRRHGRRIGLTEARLKVGQYLFRRYGGRVVFLGRFVAVLRTFAALLAGVNAMPWRRFFVANALGGFAWSAGYGFAAYLLGRSVTQIAGPIGVVLAVVAGAVVLGSAIFIKRHEASLVAEAERTLPGPLRQ